MELKIQALGKQFGEIKQVGLVGQELANQVLETYKSIKTITSTFEQETAEQDIWMQNFATFAGEEGIQYAQQVYAVLKETEMRLEALG